MVLTRICLLISRVTFLCGRAGVCALGAVAAKHAGDERLLGHYLSQFKEVLKTRLDGIFVSSQVNRLVS